MEMEIEIHPQRCKFRVELHAHRKALIENVRKCHFLWQRGILFLWST